jgi:hypothetical protein
MTPSKGAEILSTLDGEEIPFSYRYENAEGRRFLVFAFDAVSLNFTSNLFCHYARRKQIESHLDWLGANVPFRVEGNFPNLYTQCRRGEDGSLLVAICNFAETEFYDLTLHIPEGLTERQIRSLYGEMPCVKGDRLSLPTLGAYSVAAFEISGKQ